jgi:zinc transporter ZupT
LAVAKVIVPFSWNTGEPYEVGITTSDGVRFSKKVESAALTPTPNIEQASSFAIIGIYVGLIPVSLGLLWFPFVKRLSTNKYTFFLSMTMGLLVFLGIDALVEANKTAIESIAGVFNGQMLIILTILVSFLTLLYVSQKLIERGDTLRKSTGALLKASSSSSFSSADVNMQHQQQESSKTFTIALMIAVGIGLHNLGEGLAVGAAILLGKVALSTFLIVGFTLHNSTEGLAIVAPIAKRSSKVRILRLIGMGIIAGAPTIAGVWIGGFLYSSLAAIIFLSIGAGAIFQVVFSLGSWLISRSGRIISKNDNNNNDDNNNYYYSTAPTTEKIKRSVGRNSIKTSWLSTPFITGFVAGMIIMYATSLLVLS